MGAGEYVFSYGSLISRYSREEHSDIKASVIPAYLEGWQRSWCTLYEDEGATYAGVSQSVKARIGGVIIPTHVTEDLRHRERQYRFTPVSKDDLYAISSATPLDKLDGPIWICETIRPVEASRHHPLPQTYIDTCLAGCLEVGEQAGEQFAVDFIRQTTGWSTGWVNDRPPGKPIYPRRAQTTGKLHAWIDNMLAEHDLLRFRREQG